MLQLNRREREGRKGAPHIQRADAGKPGSAAGEISVRRSLWP